MLEVASPSSGVTRSRAAWAPVGGLAARLSLHAVGVQTRTINRSRVEFISYTSALKRWTWHYEAELGEEMTIEEFINWASKSGKHLFHFTDVRNLPLIKEYGLLALTELRARGIQVPAYGGNQLSHDEDQRKGIDSYVHLGFTTEHPMEYFARCDGRIGTSRYLRIDVSVLRTPGVLIAKDIANKSGVEPRPAEEMLDQLDMEVLYARTDWSDPQIKARLQAARRYEILVPQHVPAIFITNLD
jgi:hypothetical protein